MVIVYLLVAIGVLVCALQAIRTSRLLMAALWLAGCSALVALMMYLLGAPQVAVIELSVGAGLVTVLFVFAINIAGEEVMDLRSLLPRPLAVVAVVAVLALLGWIMVPVFNLKPPEIQSGRFFTAIWEERAVDMLLQIVIIFAGVLAMLGLLAEGAPPHTPHEE
ncbi:MAG: DUF4040 domain-containing protein [Anaerolineae bacterium]|nr:DUF4040 domain-containing protein [Anaerolineae bacterium]